MLIVEPADFVPDSEPLRQTYSWTPGRDLAAEIRQTGPRQCLNVYSLALLAWP